MAAADLSGFFDLGAAAGAAGAFVALSGFFALAEALIFAASTLALFLESSLAGFFAP